MQRSCALEEIAFGPDALLDCYATGIFPMADGRDDPRLFLVDPLSRGIIPLDAFHVPKRLARTVRQQPYSITINTAFDQVVAACAAPASGRLDTWINQPIIALYGALHRRGNAHSLEVWGKDGDLVGGLYGVSIGGAFFGESMFSCATDASKIALVHLVAILKAGHFTLLDTQFMTSHLAQFGTREIPRAEYKVRLEQALTVSASFPGQAWQAQRLHEGGSALQVLQQA